MPMSFLVTATPATPNYLAELLDVGSSVRASCLTVPLSRSHLFHETFFMAVSRERHDFPVEKGQSIDLPHDFGDGFFRLPRYVVSFLTDPEPKIINYGDARLEITLSREVKSYLLENYLPSTLFVSMSWGSFVVVPEIVPGRMVLLVTTLLSLVTMFDTVRNNSPDALELKCIEVWLISCTLFVFLALMEYFIVLFGIRYDKHWRTAKTKITISSPSPVPPSTLSSTGSPVLQESNSEMNRKFLQFVSQCLYFEDENIGVVKIGRLIPQPRINLAFENGKVGYWNGK
uniref:Neurotransmitter-gated ion-channel transmembrane domain-containing protein n=1 Tax=Phlebotomus papatasi TaxID=29031 RepID=A0A1B0EYE8_PHLPP